MMKKILLLTILLSLIILPRCSHNTSPLYLNPSVSIDRRVEDLLSRMTLDEKLAQLRSETDTNRIGDKGTGQFGFMNNDLSPRRSAIEYNLFSIT